MDNWRDTVGACIRTDRYKYAHWYSQVRGEAYTGELYDMLDDPQESRNLWHDPAHAGVKNELASLLIERMLTSQDAAYSSYVRKMPEHILHPGR